MIFLMSFKYWNSSWSNDTPLPLTAIFSFCSSAIFFGIFKLIWIQLFSDPKKCSYLVSQNSKVHSKHVLCVGLILTSFFAPILYSADNYVFRVARYQMSFCHKRIPIIYPLESLKFQNKDKIVPNTSDSHLLLTSIWNILQMK